MPASTQNAERAYGLPRTRALRELQLPAAGYIMPNVLGSQVDMIGT
jgi:hypothetical protein